MKYVVVGSGEPGFGFPVSGCANEDYIPDHGCANKDFSHTNFWGFDISPPFINTSN